VLFDCQACGACCCNTAKNIALDHRGYIEVLPSDVMFMRRPDLMCALTVIDDVGVHQMRLEGPEQRCTSLKGELGENVTCSIYRWRPEGCRQVTAGDEECLKARKSMRARHDNVPEEPDEDSL